MSREIFELGNNTRSSDGGLIGHSFRILEKIRVAFASFPHPRYSPEDAYEKAHGRKSGLAMRAAKDRILGTLTR